MNNFTQLVRVGQDAKVHFTQSGKAVVGFSGAYNVTDKNKDKHTIWLDCSAWGERFQKVADYLKQGALVLVQGELATRSHEGKTYLTLNVRELQLCGSKPADATK